jgi:hypothetical protein
MKPGFRLEILRGRAKVLPFSLQNNVLGLVEIDQTPAQSRSKRQSIFSGVGAGFVKVDQKQPPQVPRPKRFTA